MYGILDLCLPIQIETKGDEMTLKLMGDQKYYVNGYVN